MSNLYHRGDSLFLYVQFKDENENPISVNSPTVTIFSDPDNPLLEECSLIMLSTNEYYYNYSIPDNANFTLHEVLYEGEYNGKVARISENFHVIPTSNIYSNSIKVYGFVNQAKVGYPLIGAQTTIYDNTNKEIVSESFTNEDGRWEVFLYPGKYNFVFQKFGFKDENFSVEIGSEYNEMQFNNVSLESVNAVNKGNGSYIISDKYVTREGVPLNDLNIEVYNTISLNELAAKDSTNDDGEWQVFLDPGIYLLKVTGNSLLDDFNQTFRLKVTENGEFSFENLTQNVGVPVEDNQVGIGNVETGIKESDVVLDANGNPIIDVQLCVFPKNNLNKLVAEYYTDVNGRWEVYLEPGTYIFEFFHPEFHEFSEERTIR